MTHDRQKLDERLRKAIQNDGADAVRRLLDAGADPNAMNEMGENSLHIAADYGRTDLCALLVDAGVDVDSRSGENLLGKTNRLTPLHYAAQTGDETLCRLLVELGADPEARDVFMNTPLHRAAGVDASGTCTFLMEAGADPDAMDNDGMRPLHIAGECGSTEAAMALMDAGADHRALDSGGNTPADRARMKFVGTAWAIDGHANARGERAVLELEARAPAASSSRGRL